MDNNFRPFTVYDAVCWKMLPELIGCGQNYLIRFKLAWIKYNKVRLLEQASMNDIPALLLAGVAFVEVGGKDFTDYPVFYVRSFDWMGPNWVDNNLTITKHPMYTSFGAMSIQLRRVAETLGLDPSKLSQEQLEALAKTLQSNDENIKIIAKHLKQIIPIDFPECRVTSNLSEQELSIVATRYWWGRDLKQGGPQISSEFIRAKSKEMDSYGSRILKNKDSILGALK